MSVALESRSQAESTKSMWLIGVIATLLLAILFGAGLDVATVILLLVLLVVFTWVGARLKTEVDPWMSSLIVVAFIAKILGASVRYLTLIHLFGQGDATGYHTFAEGMAPFLRGFDIDTVLASLGNRSFGTNSTKVVLTFLYVPYIPSMYGGFILAGTISFMGQLGFYSAFRRWMPVDRLKPYAILLFFAPTLAFWPSSLGKDSVMIGCLGLAAAAFSAALAHHGLRYLALGALPLGVATLIRPHVTLLLLGSVLIALIFSHRSPHTGSKATRFLGVALVAVLVIFGAPRAVQLIDVELSAEGIDTLVERQATQTFQGDTAVQGNAATSITELPGAAIRVLYRPLANEGGSLEMLANSVEGTILLLMTLILAPRMLSRLRSGFRNPWVITCLMFTLAFVVAFSTILNLGIMARQRAQVLPFFLALIVALGWHGDDLTGTRPEARQMVETRPQLTDM